MPNRVRIAFMGPNDGGRMHQGAQAFKALEYFWRGCHGKTPAYPPEATRLGKMKWLWRSMNATNRSQCHFVVTREHRAKPWAKSQVRPQCWGLQPAHKKPPSKPEYYDGELISSLQQTAAKYYNAPWDKDWIKGAEALPTPKIPTRPQKRPHKPEQQLRIDAEGNPYVKELTDKLKKKKKSLNIGVWA